MDVGESAKKILLFSKTLFFIYLLFFFLFRVSALITAAAFHFERLNLVLSFQRETGY